MNTHLIRKILEPVQTEFDKLTLTINETTDFQSPEYLHSQREFNRLQKVLQLNDDYTKSCQHLADGQEMLKNESDEEMCNLLEEEISSLTQTIDELEDKILFALIPPDPNDDKNIFMEIRAGAGGDESGIFIGDLFRMYSLYMQAHGLKMEVMDEQDGTSGGYKEITFMIKGENAYSLFKYESGVHRVQRVPKTETQGRIHTSTVTIAVMPETPDADVDIAPEDIKIETTRAQGAGGQHVNKTESAIKIYHLPTGIVVQCQDERSQHKNKEKAMKILRAKIQEKARQESKMQEDSLRRSQIGSGDRAEKIRTYNFPQNRLTDHRIGLTLYSLDRIMNGDIDELINSLVAENKKIAIEELLREKR